MDIIYDNIHRRNIDWMQPNKNNNDKNKDGKGKDTKDTKDIIKVSPQTSKSPPPVPLPTDYQYTPSQSAVRLSRLSSQSRFTALMDSHPSIFPNTAINDCRRRLNTSPYRYCAQPWAMDRVDKPSEYYPCAMDGIITNLHRLERENKRIDKQRTTKGKGHISKDRVPLFVQDGDNSLHMGTKGLAFEAVLSKNNKSFKDMIRLLRMGVKVSEIFPGGKINNRIGKDGNSGRVKESKSTREGKR